MKTYLVLTVLLAVGLMALAQVVAADDVPAAKNKCPAAKAADCSAQTSANCPRAAECSKSCGDCPKKTQCPRTCPKSAPASSECETRKCPSAKTACHKTTTCCAAK